MPHPRVGNPTDAVPVQVDPPTQVDIRAARAARVETVELLEDVAPHQRTGRRHRQRPGRRGYVTGQRRVQFELPDAGLPMPGGIGAQTRVHHQPGIRPVQAERAEQRGGRISLRGSQQALQAFRLGRRIIVQ